jgi:hypothetical protein
MSYENYKRAASIIEQYKDKCFFAGSRPEELVTLAEKALGLKFSKAYREFVLKFGAGNFGSQEIFGVISEDFEDSSVPDGIWYTLTERNEVNLPRNLLIIYDTNSDELFCLDFSQISNEGEPAVVSFIPGVDLSKQQYKKVEEDFGNFLLNIVSNEFNRLQNS